jgi:hypothetical protein
MSPSVDSRSFWSQPYRVAASSDPDEASAQTIRIMARHVADAANDWLVRESALSAMHQFSGLDGGLDPDDDAALAAAAWWWCKVYVKFTHHEFLIRRHLGELGHLQGLIAPEILVRMKRPEGDCAIFSECVAAFLTVIGIPYEFVTVAANPNEPEIFSHVFLYAVMPDGSRLPLDASHGDYPGWQVPSAHVTRRQVWDANGRPVADRGSRFDGLHNYGIRGLGQTEGVDPQTGELYGPPTTVDATPSTTILDYTTGFPVTGSYLDASGNNYSGQAIAAPAAPQSASNAAQWAAFSTAALKAGLTLAEINAIQPGTVVGANGQILRQNPGYAVGSPAGTFNVGTGLSSGTILLGALLLGGVVLISSMGGRR